MKPALQRVSRREAGFSSYSGKFAAALMGRGLLPCTPDLPVPC